jgi:hypothetical protein
MATYKLTRLPDINGEINYDLKCMDEWDFTLVSWDYEKLYEIASRLEVGEEYILNV